VFLLLEHDFRCALAEQPVASIVPAYDGAHRLSYRVERVDLVDHVLRHLIAHQLVALTEIQYKPEQCTLRLVTDLLR